jgi:hypothetical protein
MFKRIRILGQAFENLSGYHALSLLNNTPESLSFQLVTSTSRVILASYADQDNATYLKGLTKELNKSFPFSPYFFAS